MKKKERKKEERNSHCWGRCSLKSEHVLNFVFLSGKTLARSCKRCMPSEYRIHCNTDTPWGARSVVRESPDSNTGEVLSTIVRLVQYSK